MNGFQQGQCMRKASLLLAKAVECRQRIGLDLDSDEFSNVALKYVLEQVQRMCAYASEARAELEKIQVARGVAIAQELARRRLEDPSYTPSINEAADNMNSFMEGFREG